MRTLDACFQIYNAAAIIRRFIAAYLNSFLLLAHSYLRLSCFASLDALLPRVLECCVASCPAFSEPGTATSAAAEFAGFLDSTTRDAR